MKHEFSAEYLEYLESETWKKKRLAAIKRAGGACQVCNAKKRLDAHHRTYANFKNEQDSDITVLCRKCHELFHHAKRSGNNGSAGKYAEIDGANWRHSPRFKRLTKRQMAKMARNQRRRWARQQRAIDKANGTVRVKLKRRHVGFDVVNIIGARSINPGNRELRTSDCISAFDVEMLKNTQACRVEFI